MLIRDGIGMHSRRAVRIVLDNGKNGAVVGIAVVEKQRFFRRVDVISETDRRQDVIVRCDRRIVDGKHVDGHDD